MLLRYEQVFHHPLSEKFGPFALYVHGGASAPPRLAAFKAKNNRRLEPDLDGSGVIIGHPPSARVLGSRVQGPGSGRPMGDSVSPPHSLAFSLPKTWAASSCWAYLAQSPCIVLSPCCPPVSSVENASHRLTATPRDAFDVPPEVMRDPGLRILPLYVVCWPHSSPPTLGGRLQGACLYSRGEYGGS